MRLLLDTHALIWWVGDDSHLGALAREAIASPENDVFVSPASIWEIGIKQKKGMLEAPDDLVAAAERSFIEVPITFRHAEQAGMLPRHHDDPFDRMLIAQAQAEGLTIVTADAAIRRYGVWTMPADE